MSFDECFVCNDEYMLTLYSQNNIMRVYYEQMKGIYS